VATNGQEESRRLQDFVRRVGDLREVFGPVDIRYEWSLAVIQAAWELVLEAARDLTRRGHAEFSRAQLLDEVLRRDPSRVPQSLGPVIQGMTANASGGPPSPCGTPLERIAHGHYRLLTQSSAPTPSALRSVAPETPYEAARSTVVDLVLVGCAKTKASTASPARTLYQSSLFEKRRRYAETRGRSWYVLSAEHGLVHPDALLEPYDVALAEQSDDYRRAWAHWVAAKLRRVEGELHGRVIEIHAGAAYAGPLLPLLRAAGAVVSQPTVGLRQGEQLAWYDRDEEPAVAEPPAASLGNPIQRTAEEQAIVESLLRYGREHANEHAGEPPQFTPHAEANRLILENPFAFLLAVIFDQGIPAERAWRAPYQLRTRLGHLDPAQMVVQPEQVRVAVAQPPALHRYVNNLPSWLVAAAQKVLDEYAGAAGLIWADRPKASELARRLRAFPGIGQKKAAMAVEILARDLEVPVAELSGSDIAFDVHVRRVFLRTQLAEYDDLDHIVEVARRLHPVRPGELDFPAWLIGRRWCGAGVPACMSCVLVAVCPRDVGRASAVHGS